MLARDKGIQIIWGIELVSSFHVTEREREKEREREEREREIEREREL